MLGLKNLFLKITELVIPHDKKIGRLLNQSPSQLRKILPKAEDFRDRDDRTISIFNYKNYNVRALVWAMKYKANPEVIHKMAELMHEEILTLAEEKLILEGKSSVALIPIPMSKNTFKKRGYNQCELLCQAISKISKGEIKVLDILEKSRETGHQTTLKRKERLENMRNSMKIGNWKFNENSKLKIGNSLLIIIDDVYTTGATIKEARRALGTADFENVLALTIAH